MNGSWKMGCGKVRDRAMERTPNGKKGGDSYKFQTEYSALLVEVHGQQATVDGAMAEV